MKKMLFKVNILRGTSQNIRKNDEKSYSVNINIKQCGWFTHFREEKFFVVAEMRVSDLPVPPDE